MQIRKLTHDDLPRASAMCLDAFMLAVAPSRSAQGIDTFSREIWMAVHRDLRHSPQVRAVMDFLLKIVTQNAAFTLNG